MSQENAQISAATTDLVLAGETYTASPITDRGWDELDSWLQTEVVRVVRDQISFELQEAESKEEENLIAAKGQMLLEDAMKIALSVSFHSEAGQLVLQSPRGAARAAYQFVRHNHKDVKYKDILSLFRKDPQGCQLEVWQKLKFFHGKIDKEYKGPPGGQSGNEQTP